MTARTPQNSQGRRIDVHAKGDTSFASYCNSVRLVPIGVLFHRGGGLQSGIGDFGFATFDSLSALNFCLV